MKKIVCKDSMTAAYHPAIFHPIYHQKAERSAPGQQKGSISDFWLTVSILHTYIHVYKIFNLELTR